MSTTITLRNLLILVVIINASLTLDAMSKRKIRSSVTRLNILWKIQPTFSAEIAAIIR